MMSLLQKLHLQLKHKKINNSILYNENDIIGHITGSYVVDKEGNKVEAEEAPKDFDISEAVLYNSWTDPENKKNETNYS